MIKERYNSGITLIALVVSIIVLLILAGVSISMLIGDNGILTRAKDASKKTSEASELEQRKLAMAEAAMNFEETEYKDENEEEVTIPEGFAVSQVEGENTVKDGLVIIDSKGNEFVWVPAYLEGEEPKFKDAVVYEKWQGSENYTIPNFEGKDETPNGINETDQISKYGGFFVGRFETGRNDIDNVTLETNSVSDGIIPLIKKGSQPWNLIGYENAKKVSESYLSNESVQSGLITGTQWDTIMAWAEDEGKPVRDGNTIDWGTYKNTILTINGRYSTVTDNDLQTWQTGDYEKIDTETPFYTGTGLNVKSSTHNIYDLAGNLWEMTTEHNYNPLESNRILARGCGGNGDNSISPMARSNVRDDTEAFCDLGFRIVLFLK